MSEQNTEFDDGFDLEEVEQSASGDKKPSLGQRLKTSVAGSGRSLLLVFAMAVVAVAGSGWGIMKLMNAQSPQSSAKLDEAPEREDPATGEGDVDPRYADLIREENEERSSRALETGQSALLTLVDEPQQGEPEAADCDQECRDLRDTVERVTREAEAAQHEAERARDRLARQQEAMQALRDDEAYQPSRYVHRDQLHMTPEANAQRRERMRSEMGHLASVMMGGEGHGYAEVQSASMGGGSRDGAPSSSSSSSTRAHAEDTAQSRQDGGAPRTEAGRSLISAAETVYVTLDMTANSDVPDTTIRATVRSGPHRGSAVLGQYEVNEEYMVMKFDRLVTPDDRMYAIDAIAVDPQTRMAGMADEVDRHILAKLGTVFGAAFLQGFGEAFRESGQVEVTGGDTITSRSTLETTEDKALAALGPVGEKAASMLEPYASRPTTVTKYADTGMSLLFLDSVTEGDRQDG